MILKLLKTGFQIQCAIVMAGAKSGAGRAEYAECDLRRWQAAAAARAGSRLSASWAPRSPHRPPVMARRLIHRPSAASRAGELLPGFVWKRTKEHHWYVTNANKKLPLWFGIRWCSPHCTGVLLAVCCWPRSAATVLFLVFARSFISFLRITPSTLDPPFITPKGQKNIIGRVPLVKVCRIFWQTHPPGTF